DLDAVALACQRPRHDDVVLDPGGGEPKDAGRSPQLWVEVRIDHLFLAAEPIERLRLAQILDRGLAHDRPIGLAGPTRRSQRLWIALGHPDLVDIFAEPDIGGPAAELGAAGNVKNRHFLPSESHR